MTTMTSWIDFRVRHRATLFVLVVAIFLPLGILSAETDDPKTDTAEPGDEAWFSLDPGDAWTFEDEVGKMSIKVLAEEELGDTKAVRVGWFLEGSDDPYQAEYWRKEGENYLVVAREIAGRKLVFDEPYVFLRETIQPGDSWTSTLKLGGRRMELTFTVGEAETIETGVGSFEAMKVSVTGPPQLVDRWYAPAIGMVKERTRLSIGGRTSPGNEKVLVEHTEGGSADEETPETEPAETEAQSDPEKPSR